MRDKGTGGQLLDGVRVTIETLRATGCRRVYRRELVTGKEPLAVFDACWESGGVLDPMLVDFGDRRAAQKATQGAEPFSAQAAAEPGGITYLDFLGLDRLARRRKGVIVIELEAPT